MARSGVGGNAGFDDTDPFDQYCGALFDAPKVLKFEI
jgi:hypothetical protein